MNVNLEQSLAAVVRFIQDNSEEGTQLYFDEIPENFYVPSVYFQIPYSAGRKGFLTGNGNQAPVSFLYRVFRILIRYQDHLPDILFAAYGLVRKLHLLTSSHPPE